MQSPGRRLGDAEHLRTELILDALEMAVWNRRPAPGLVHHSDHGCQYTSLAFGQRRRQSRIARSMGSVGDCYDNALAESFFATLECELIARSRWRTRSEPPSAYLRRGNVYFNCESDEKLPPTVLERLGEDQMMASADMPHLEARENSLQDISERNDLTAAQKRKILGENARCFYGL